MRYALFSDVHANPAAFEAALADAREQGAEKFLCLGDVVGYGPDAAGAVASVRNSCEVVLMGNHDAATAQVIDYWNFRPEAQAGVRRHARELDAESLAWLRQLPYVHRARTFVAAHGTLFCPEQFGYIFRADQALAAFSQMGDERVLFVGHTHASMFCKRNAMGLVTMDRADALMLMDDCQYIVNVGSVGYPRCEPHSVYAIYDSRRRIVVWRRLPFDFPTYFAQMKAKKIFIPPWLQESAESKGEKQC